MQTEQAPLGAFSLADLAAMVRDPAQRGLVGRALPECIKQPEQVLQFLELYWAQGRVPLARQVKIGLSEVFRRLPPQSLLECRNSSVVSLGDVLCMVRAKPHNPAQAAVFKALIGNR